MITRERGFGQDFWGVGEFRGEGGGVILFWVRWRVRKRIRKENLTERTLSSLRCAEKVFTTEDTESTEYERS